MYIVENWVWEVRDCKTLNQSSSSFNIDCSWSGEPGDNTFIFEVGTQGDEGGQVGSQGDEGREPGRKGREEEREKEWMAG